jgi:hypothetical protein
VLEVEELEELAGDSSSVMFSVAVTGVPSTAPPFALLTVSVIVRVPSVSVLLSSFTGNAAVLCLSEKCKVPEDGS